MVKVVAGGDMSMSEETAVAVALTRMDGKLDQIQDKINHQTEIMGRNREDAVRDVQTLQAELTELQEKTTKLDGRVLKLEKENEQRVGMVRVLTIIAGVAGTLAGLAVGIISKIM